MKITTAYCDNKRCGKEIINVIKPNYTISGIFKVTVGIPGTGGGTVFDLCEDCYETLITGFLDQREPVGEENIGRAIRMLERFKGAMGYSDALSGDVQDIIDTLELNQNKEL